MVAIQTGLRYPPAAMLTALCLAYAATVPGTALGADQRKPGIVLLMPTSMREYLIQLQHRPNLPILSETVFRGQRITRTAKVRMVVADSDRDVWKAPEVKYVLRIKMLNKQPMVELGNRSFVQFALRYTFSYRASAKEPIKLLCKGRFLSKHWRESSLPLEPKHSPSFMGELGHDLTVNLAPKLIDQKPQNTTSGFGPIYYTRTRRGKDVNVVDLKLANQLPVRVRFDLEISPNEKKFNRLSGTLSQIKLGPGEQQVRTVRLTGPELGIAVGVWFTVNQLCLIEPDLAADEPRLLR